MKKILFVANVGKEHILKFHLPSIKQFKDHGWQVDVACEGDDPIPLCDNHIHAQWKRSPFTPATIKGTKQLKRIINDEHYDIIYCHTPVGGLCGRLAAKKARKNGTKVVYCAHGLHFFKGAPLQNWLMFYPVEKWLARHTDLFLTINGEDFERVKRRFNKRMTVKLINGIGVNFDRLQVENRAEVRAAYRQKLGIADNAPVLIYVAEIIKNKNQKMLVDTVARLKATRPDIVLLLVGPEHDDGALRAYIDKQGLSDSIKLLGWRSDVGECMITADICVPSSIRKGFPINPLEAMYCGLPVVASKNRGHNAAITDGENGFLVDLNDSATMAERISQLLTDKDLYDKLSHIDVSKFDCDHIAQDIYEILTND